MNIIQKKLVESYAVLVMAEIIAMNDIPETKQIGSTEYPIRSEVEIEIAKRTIEVLG